MSNNNKIVPKLRFPEFENDKEWESKLLNEICKINPPSRSLPEVFVYIDLESVNSGKLNKKKTIKLKEAPSRAQRLLKNGDVIFQMVRPYQQNNYFFKPDDDLEYVASTGYAQLRAIQSNIFLFQYLHTRDFVNKVLSKCTGSNYPAINSSDLSKIEVKIPQPKEQQKIASCLSSLDELITAHSEKLETLKEHKKGLMQNLFPQEGKKVPNYRFPEFESDGEWEWPKLEDKMDIFRGASPRPKGDPKYYGGNIPRLMIQDVTRDGKYSTPQIDFLTDAGAAKSRLLRKGSVVLSCSGTRVAIPGILAVDACIHDGWLGFKNFKDVDPEFLYYHFCNFHDKVQGAALAGGVFNNLTTTILKEMKLGFPKLKEQQKVSSCLSITDELINAQAEKIEQLQQHKKGLMQGLFPKMSKL